MDTTTVAPPVVRAWELLAALAACRQAGDGTSQDLAQRIADLARDHLPCPWGLVLLHSVGGERASAAWGLDDERLHALMARNGHPLPEDAAEIPLHVADEPAGAILLAAGPEAQAILSPGFLLAIRNQVELLLTLQRREDDRRLRSRMQQLKALQHISRELTATLYLHNILGFALKESLRATQASHGYIALRGYIVQREGYDLDQDEALGVTTSPQVYIALRAIEEGGPIRVIAAAGYTEAEQHLLLNHDVSDGTTVAEAVMATGEPLTVDTLAHDDRPRGVGPQVASALVAPIYYEAQAIGVVNLHSQAPRAFDRDALEFARAVADQIALAIGNEERYYEQRRQRDLLQQRASTLNEVLRIGQELRADRSLEDVLEQIAFSVAETAHFRAVVFYLMDDDPQQMRLIAGAGLPLVDLARLRQAPLAVADAQRLFDRRFHLGRCSYVPRDALRELDVMLSLAVVGSELEQRQPHEWQPGDLVVVPLQSTQGTLLGLMLADEPYDRQRPSRRSVEPLEIFADQAAIAIENARLLREARSQAEQMTALYRVSSAAVSTLDLDELLERAYDEITAYMGTPSFLFIASYDARRDTIHLELFKREGRLHAPHHKSTIRKSGLTGWIIDHGEALHIRDMLSGDLPAAPVSLGEPVRSWIGIPLRSQNTVIGVLSVQSFEPNAFSDRDEQFLTTLANQLAVALENARLFQERERRISELDVINRIGHITSSTLNVEQLLGQVYDCLAGFLSLDSFFGVVYHSDRNEIAMGLLVDEGERTFVRASAPPPEGSLVQWIIANRQPLRFRDLRAEAGALGLRPGSFGNETRDTASWMGVPLLVGEGEVVGVLSVQSHTPDLYGERELAFLGTVASQVALGVQNARLFEERERQIVELDALGRIGRATSSTLDLRPMVEELSRVLREVLDAESVSLTLFGRDRGLERLLVIDGDRPVLDTRAEPAFDRREETLAGWVARHGRQLRIGDLAEVRPAFADTHLLLAAGTPRSYLGIPILAYDGTPIGALGVASRRPAAFSARDESFLTSVGAQLSLGVQNTQLLAEAQGSASALQAKVGELSTLLQAAQVLSSSLQPGQVLNTLMEVVERQLAVNTVALWKLAEDHTLVPAAMAGIPPDVARRLRVPVGQGLTGRVAASSRPLVVEDVEQEGSSLYPAFNRQNQYTSFMGVPVVYQEQTIGVLSVMTVQRRRFNADDVQLLAGLADQAAIALENARLFAEREQRIAELTTINNISQAINATLDLDELLMALHTGISAVLDTSESFIALYDARTRRLTFPLVFDEGRRRPDHEQLWYVVEDNNGLTDTVVYERRPLLLRTQEQVDAISSIPTPPGERPICSWLGVPIIQGDEVLGVLNVQSYEPNKFGEDALRFLTTVANQAAIALNNVRLFQSEQARRRVADTLREVALSLTGVLQLDEIMSLILDQLGRVIPYDTASLMLREGETLRMAAARGFEEPVRSRVEQLNFGVDDDPYLQRVVRSKRPWAVADLRAENLPSNAPEDGTEHIRSWIGAPLLLNDEVIGVLNVDSRTPGAYSDEDAQLAFALASQAAQAIRNARLFAEVRRFTAELEQRVEERTAALAEVNSQLAAERDRLEAVHAITLELTASLDLEKTLNKALGLAAAAVGAQRGSIMLLDPQSGTLTCRAVLTADSTVQSTSIPITFAHGLGLAGWVMKRQEAVCIADVRADARWLREEGRADEVRSVIAAPLMTQDGPLGVLMLSSPRVSFFSQEQVQLLATIANEVAIVIHNATLYTVINEIAMERGELWAQQREENSKNQAILQSLGEGVMVLDERQRVVLFNAAAEQMLAIPAASLVGQPLAHLLRHTGAGTTAARAEMMFAGLRQGLEALAEQGRNHNRLIELPAPEQTIALNFAPWVDPRGNLYGSVVVLRDITREIEADRAKRDFISSVSHELRTPLTSIKGYVDLLLLGAAGQLSEGQLSFLSVVKNNANRLMDLINDILEIGRIDANKIQLNFEQVNIEHVLQDVLQTLRAEIDRKQLVVALELTPGIPPIVADPRRLTQVVMNLISNAVKYTYPKGRVALRASLNPAGLLQVDVEDNGVGISPEQQQHLFRRFYRADNPLRDEAGGTGLGLSIAKSLVELHGGEMWVESEIGKGSTFSFIVPTTQPEPGESTDVAA
ncbi:MAG TPA: GAF domain-containing protein [Roseiflexaceae bacterium]|nr:GAF domain-containing protein [Roseiflexaceae bacterium]